MAFIRMVHGIVEDEHVETEHEMGGKKSVVDLPRRPHVNLVFYMKMHTPSVEFKSYKNN